MLDGRAHVTALDRHRTGDLHDRLDVRRPQLRPLPPRALRHRKQPLNLDLRAREHRRGKRPGCRQRRVLEQQLGGKPAHPAKKLPDPPAPDELAVVLDEQLGHRLGVPRGGGVLDRVLDEPVRTAPGRRAATQHRRLLAPELQLQKLAEQMVIAVPLPARVQGDQEHVRARELREHRGRVLAAEDRVAQLGREPSQHRGAQQKVPGLGRERRQNLIRQVVRDVPSAADERPHPLIGVLEVTQPQRRQVQPRRPSLRTLDEQLDALARQLDPLTQDQLTRLSTVNASSRARISTSAPRARRRARLIAGSERVDASTRALAGSRSIACAIDRSERSLSDRVKIIEHDRYRLAVRDQAVHQLIDGRLDRRAPDAEAHQRPTPEALPSRSTAVASASTTAPDHRQPHRASSK